MCETSFQSFIEERNMLDNEVCDSAWDATMVVVADFASMLANGMNN